MNTPRTDAFEKQRIVEAATNDIATEAWADFARQLERENESLREALKEVLSHRKEDKDGNHVMWIGEGTFLKCEQALSVESENKPESGKDE